jgi:Na+/proline symporter
MGSLSTALNALATSFSRDFALPALERRGILVDEWQRVRVLRQSTVGFAILIIIVGVATARFMAKNPNERIIPLVLGILGFTFGSLLGLFLAGLFTRKRGNDWGNALGVFAGIAAVAWASGVPHKFFPSCPELIPGFILAFPWRITLGTIVTFLVAVCFPTPEDRIAARAAADATHA